MRWLALLPLLALGCQVEPAPPSEEEVLRDSIAVLQAALREAQTEECGSFDADLGADSTGLVAERADPTPNPDRVNPADVDRTAATAATVPGALQVPVAGVAPRDLVDTFSAARTEGRRHNAIDIMAPRGTPVVAAAGGQIVRLFASERGGKTVYQLGDDGETVFYYAHLDAYAASLQLGARVQPGDPIGTVGSTGNASADAPHLHFAIWTVDDPAHFWDGRPVNPYPLLAP